MFPLPQNDDVPRDLPGRIRNGDAAAESELVRFFHRRIEEFAIARTGDRDLAQEVAQETLWAVVRALREGRLRQEESLKSFVYGVARNQLNDRLRSRAREKLDQLDPKLDLPQPAPDYEEEERRQVAERAIGELEPTDRRILLMVLVDGLKATEIAARTGLRADGIRQRKARAIKKLLTLLNPLSRNAAREPLSPVKPQ